MRPPPHARRFVGAICSLACAVATAFGIVGGVPASPGENPWAAALITKGSTSFQGQFCGAVIIHPRWALTAANCVEGVRTGSIEVGVGSDSLSALQRIGVDDIIIHPDFNPTTFDADLALLLLAEEIPSTAAPIELLDEPAWATPGTIARIAGWGSTVPAGDVFPDWLHTAPLPIIENEVGNVLSIYNGALNERMLIAGYAAGGVGFCFADTGGPLVVPDGKGGHRLVGVASFGRPGATDCAGPNAYGGFTLVPAFRDWIQSHTRPDYAAWEFLWELAGATRDREGDGRSNYCEFAGGSNPLTGEGEPELRFGVVDVEGVDYPAVDIVLRTDTEEIAYGLEFSVDFEVWQPVDLVANRGSAVPLEGQDGAERVTFRAPVSLGGLPDGQAFFRKTVQPSGEVSNVSRTISAPGFGYSSLSSIDHVDDAMTYYKDFTLSGALEGVEWNAVLRSSDFNPVLQLLDGSTGSVIAESSGGSAGGEDERLVFTSDAAVSHVLRVKASGPEEAGGFSLALAEALPELPVAGAGVTQGSLDEGDPTDPSGLPLQYYLDRYLVEGANYERLVYAFLDSDQTEGGFDPFLRISNAETGVTVAENDDIAAGNANAFGVFTAEPRVPYVVEATSFEPEKTGSYTITLFPLRQVIPGTPIVGRLKVGDAIDGSGAFYDSYYLPAPPANSTVTVTLASEEIDPFLIHFDAGFTELEQDDNGGGGTTAQIVFVADGESSYIFDASSAAVGETGIYVINIEVGGID